MADEGKRLRQKAWREANRDVLRTKALVRLADPKKKAAKQAYRREWGQRNRLKLKDYMRDWQGYPKPTRPMPERCENCDGPPNGRGNGFYLDHDHTTGRFRGWLCSTCNSGIGKLGDSIEGVRRALAYLERSIN